MTEAEIKQKLRGDRLEYLFHTATMSLGGDELNALQVNLIDALVTMAKSKPDSLCKIFRSILASKYPNETLAVRSRLKHICATAGVLMPLALYDYQTGKLVSIARGGQSGIQAYAEFMLSECDSDDVQEILENYLTTCEDCGEWESQDEMRSTYNDHDICRSCMENEYEWSDYYDTYVHRESARSGIDRNGNDVTVHRDDDDFEYDDEEDCYVHHEYKGRIIGSYHSSKSSFSPISSVWTQANSFYISKIVDIHNPPPRLERYFGVELEVEVKHGDRVDCATAINDVVNDGKVGKFCFFENDGSLSHGFEIITQPMGLDLHAKFWEWVNNKDLSRGLLSHNTSTCGLHVHVSRLGLTRLQLSKMVAFVNHPDNRALLEALARRYGSNYATYSSTKRIGNALREANGRYEALSLDPRRTIEFRMFKGSLKYESIMSAVEFANALVNFCNDQSGYGFKLDTKSFMQFIETPAMANDTKHLRPYIANKLESQ